MTHAARTAPRCRSAQRGAALLVAMLTVALVATLAAAAVWQQWRHTEVEQAERERQQAAWILTGALDWARLILREDARTNQNTGASDNLSEPWAVGLEEARLSSFLAADKTQDPPPALDAFLSGAITDQQGMLNMTNLVQQGALSEPDLKAFARLFQQLGLNTAELNGAARLWVSTVLAHARSAGSSQSGTGPGASGGQSGRGASAQSDAATSTDNTVLPVLPQRLAQLTWLGLSSATVARLQGFVTILPQRTTVNVNTAPPEVLMASIPNLSAAQARRIVEHRALQPFKLLSDINPLVGSAEVSGSAHTTQSRYFLVQGRLRMGERVVEEHSLVVRNGLEVSTLWRQRAQPAPPGQATTAGTDPSALTSSSRTSYLQ